MKILLIGRYGQVAWELQRSLACLGEVIVVDRHTQPLALDLGDADSITQVVLTVKPDLIVNAAAYTAVDKAEQEVELAMQINGTALGMLAEAAKQVKAALIHYSTDYVFDGTASSPYLEADPTAPQGIYGRSKCLGEQAIAASGVDYLVLRTAWVYGNRGLNFLLTMLRLMRERDSLGVVSDQIGAPTWSRHIAEATALIVARSSGSQGIQLGERCGIYHLTNAGQTAWFGFAQAIYEQALSLGILNRELSINPITTQEYPTPARRPAYSVLAGDKLLTAFQIALPAWQSALSNCLADHPAVYK